jgi:Fe-Mn family superoxide dismutase
MAHTLPDLPYPYDALEPHIDARTMEIHHGKHHAAYVNNLNKAIEGHPGLQQKSVEDLLRDISVVPESIRQAVINHGGGHANHAHFWRLMGPGGGGKPVGELAAAIESAFGGFDTMKQQFTKAALTQFGSGWAWLALDENGELGISSYLNQDSPIAKGHRPILCIDVWEHAYYLKYQNRRPDYVEAWWNTVDWEKVNGIYVEVR